MRTLLKLTVTVAVLLAGGLCVFYVYMKNVAAEKGESYSFSQVPGDLVGELKRRISSDGAPSKTQPPGAPDAPDVPPAGPTNGAEQPSIATPPADHWAEGRTLYLAGDFQAALRKFDAAGRNTSERAAGIRDRARLFHYLVEDVAPGSGLSRLPRAQITLARGEPFLAVLVEETPDEVTFKKADGVGARVKKSELKSLRIARTEDQMRALAEASYQRRHATLASAEDNLELARFCREYGLDDHVTYLLERALDAGSPGLEAKLNDMHETAWRGGAFAHASLVADLMRVFYPSGELTRGLPTSAGAAVAKTSPRATPRSPVRGPDRPRVPKVDDQPAPASGIGGTGGRTSRPRSSNPEINDALTRADELRRKADEHYVQALPGSPDAATHRKKALALYTEAQQLYETVEEKWGVGLERTFRELQLRRYQLLKDTPAK